eukprot:2603236-Prymnesium_polylepis.2
MEHAAKWRSDGLPAGTLTLARYAPTPRTCWRPVPHAASHAPGTACVRSNHVEGGRKGEVPVALENADVATGPLGVGGRRARRPVGAAPPQARRAARRMRAKPDHAARPTQQRREGGHDSPALIEPRSEVHVGAEALGRWPVHRATVVEVDSGQEETVCF